jgi:hypothetical protein
MQPSESKNTRKQKRSSVFRYPPNVKYFCLFLSKEEETACIPDFLCSKVYLFDFRMMYFPTRP